MEQIIKQILDKEDINYKVISKATSGFTNLVYFIDDVFVLKMSKDELIKKKLQKEISIYQNINLSYIPKLVASGSNGEYDYLIISKVQGCSLYSIWHTLSEDERFNCVKQIARMLKEFNGQNVDFIANEYKDLDWVGFITNELKAKSKSLKDLGFDTGSIDNLVAIEIPNLFKENCYGLVYNDAHFDNFIYDNGKLSLIDFDRVRVCPIDYEMLIFKTMCENPSKFASEEDEDNINEKDYAKIYEWFKNEYREMFACDNAEDRIEIYRFNYLIGQAIKCKDMDWINELLGKFTWNK